MGIALEKKNVDLLKASNMRFEIALRLLALDDLAEACQKL